MVTKRVFALACALVLAAALFAGCTPAKKDANVLLVGTEIGYPPFEMFSDDGKTPIGLDIDLAKEIGKILSKEIRFQNADFEGILDGLVVDKYDLVMSAVTITPERAEKVDFSDPYIENWQAIIVKKGAAPIESPEGLTGKNVAYQKATTSTAYLKKLRDTGAVTPNKVEEYEKVMNCFDDLRLGRVDAVLCDSVVAGDYEANDPDVFEITWVQSAPDEPELFGIGVKKGSTELLEAVNGALAQMKASGKYAEICKSWGLEKSMA